MKKIKLFRIVFFVLIFMEIFFINIYSIDNKNNILDKKYIESAETNQIVISNLKKPKYIRGIHVTAWAAGSKSFQNRYDNIIKNTEINTMVIAVKEANGEVYIDGVQEAKDMNAYRKAIPKIKEYIDYLHKNNIFVIARIVLFKDPIFAEKHHNLAVKNKSGNIWRDYKGLAWVDPFKKQVWEYNFKVVDACLAVGFDEIQFDYVRYPSDGNISECRYSVEFSSTVAVNNLSEFLKESKKRYGAKTRLTVDVFGLTTSATDDLGIGQVIEKMEPFVDALYPMVYPSHYRKGTYNLKDPNKSPYMTVYKGMMLGKQKLKDKSYKFIPYLQDFSLGYRYGKHEIREQIQALYDNDIPEWILWDPKALYTLESLLPKSESNKYKNLRAEREKKELVNKNKEEIIKTNLDKKSENNEKDIKLEKEKNKNKNENIVKKDDEKEIIKKEQKEEKNLKEKNLENTTLNNKELENNKIEKDINKDKDSDFLALSEYKVI